MRAVVLVIGDLGRSPRMLAHASSLLRAGCEVHLVGETRTPIPQMLQREPGLHVHPLDGIANTPGALATGLRGIRLAARLAQTLRNIPAPDLFLVQTPPALPTLPVTLLAARLRGARLVVDWHNLTWTMLALRFGTDHALVRATRHAEMLFGRRADAHLAVSTAMASRLTAFGMRNVTVLHDGSRPFPPARTDLPAEPLTVVAPMGWTRDDDLALLAEALQLLQHPLRRRLRLIVSGAGPLRAEWGPRLRAFATESLQVETLDVPTEEYPDLLAASHLGLSLHRSSSGLDLPIKILEMRTVGIPVLALDDGSPLDEIAPPGCGVVRYRTAQELATHLQLDADALTRLTGDARRHPPAPWDETWTTVMSPFMTGVR